MAANLSRASSTDNLLSNDELEMEKKQQYSRESPNDYDSDDTRGVPITGSTTSQRTKPRLSVCCPTYTKRVNNNIIMIAALFVAVLSLAADNIYLRISMGELHHRVDRLETQSSSAGTFLTVLNKTQLNSSSELEEYGEILLHLSAKLENVEDRISIFENTLSNSLLLLTDVDEAASNNISDLQRSLGLIEEDIDLTITQFQNLSSMYTDLRSDYDATIHNIHSMWAIIKQNASQLHDLIHQVEKNHSSILVKLSRDLNEAAMNRSMLAQRIEDTSNLVASQRQIINGIRSNVTAVQDSVTGLHGTLTTNVNNLNTRIDGHVKWSKDQHSSILIQLSSDLNEAARHRSTLAQKIDDTANSVRSQAQTIGGLRSDVTAVQGSVTRLRETQTTDVKTLNNRIDDRVDQVQHNLDELSQTVTNFDSRMHVVERELESGAARIKPLGFLLLSAIALLSVCYVTL
jgi:chromosome segregation ATPase